jgi:protein NDRG3
MAQVKRSLRVVADHKVSHHIDDDDKIFFHKSPYGNMQVRIRGDTSKPALLLMHDVGITSAGCFASFLNYVSNNETFQQFCILDVNAPGHEYGAEDLSPDIIAFDFDVLAQQLPLICDRANITDVIGFGIGAGANVLLRFAVSYFVCILL